MPKDKNGITKSSFNDAKADRNNRQDNQKDYSVEFGKDEVFNPSFKEYQKGSKDAVTEQEKAGIVEFGKEYEHLVSSNNQEHERMQKTSGTGNPNYH